MWIGSAWQFDGFVVLRLSWAILAQYFALAKNTCARGRVRDDGALCLGSFSFLGLSHEASLLPLPGAGHGQRKCAEDQRRRWQVERNLQIPHFLFRRVVGSDSESTVARFLAHLKN